MDGPDGGRSDLLRRLDALLTRVEKPTRYIGGEWNSVVKPAAEVDVSVVLAFPDLYEIGMSHLGFRILYALLNAMPGVAAERAFMPWIDMLTELRRRDLPLTTLESRKPLGRFDLVGFSMQYELTITNVLTMLDLGGIPPRSADREESHPLVLGGGPVLVNPEPFADFFDLILIGEGEEAFGEMITLYRRLRAEGRSRGEILSAIADLEGWYVPALYDLEPEPLTGQLIPRPRPGGGAPEKVRRRILYDLNSVPFPEKIVVPHGDIVHDRVSWEIQRGCPVGCRFCQAGYIYRPTRERDPAQVREGVRRSIEATGYDEFSLTSLNTGEYGAIEPLLTQLMDEMEPRSVSVGLSSLHASTMTENLAAQVRRVRKTGFTIAPEAGSQRLRDVINKNLTEAQILEATRLAFEAGWTTIKLYFMIGLPTETTEDVEAQVDLAERILEQGRRIGGKRVKVTLSASTFVPKVFTPFQWFGMQSEKAFMAKQELIRRRVPRGVQFRHHHHGESWLEGVLSRADRSVAPAIYEAWRRGAVLDGWTEHFRVEVWREAFAGQGIDADHLATRELPLKAELPWEVVDPLIRRRWLEREYEKACRVATVVPCSSTACTACGPFARECIKGIVAEQHWNGLEVAPRAVVAREPAAGSGAAEGEEEPPPRPVYRYRIHFEKLSRARFLGHLDLVRALLHGLRRAGIQLAYSQGFKPRPKISLGPALALGIASVAEYADLETHTPLAGGESLAWINRHLSEGLTIRALVGLAPGSRSLQEDIVRAGYRAFLPGIGGEEVRRRVAAFLGRQTVVVERLRKGKLRRIDLRPLVAWAGVGAAGELEFEIRFTERGSARPREVIAAIVGEDALEEAEILRTRQVARVGHLDVSPLVAGRQGLPRSA
ncbi:MAG: TIGR03960 family B12-binding radical SAM protein [Acidobacteriota bacterium]|nr:TIGR03960 family B12-binding radical SAM protein [Acidobacteriota bacterium]